MKNNVLLMLVLALLSVNNLSAMHDLLSEQEPSCRIEWVKERNDENKFEFKPIYVMRDGIWPKVSEDAVKGWLGDVFMAENPRLMMENKAGCRITPGGSCKKENCDYWLCNYRSSNPKKS